VLNQHLVRIEQPKGPLELFVSGRGYALPEDVKDLTPDVLRHRLVLTYEAEAQGVSADEIIERLLESVGIP